MSARAIPTFSGFTSPPPGRFLLQTASERFWLALASNDSDAIALLGGRDCPHLADDARSVGYDVHGGPRGPLDKMTPRDNRPRVAPVAGGHDRFKQTALGSQQVVVLLERFE